MSKLYPFGKPGHATENALSLQSFKIEIKKHYPIIGMGGGKVNEEVWGAFGEWLLQSPTPPEDYSRAWQCWAARGPEISIAYGLGPDQAKFAWYEGELFLIPAFPTSFGSNYHQKLQAVYKGAHVKGNRTKKRKFESLV